MNISVPVPAPKRTPCWNDIINNPFFLRYRTETVPEGQYRPPPELMRTSMSQDAWSYEPMECRGCICRILSTALFSPFPLKELNEDVWTNVIEYVGIRIEVCRPPPTSPGHHLPNLLDHWHNAGWSPFNDTVHYRKPSPMYGPVNWYIDTDMFLHHKPTTYYGSPPYRHYITSLIGKPYSQEKRHMNRIEHSKNRWSVVRAAFSSLTFFFILKLKVLARRKIRQRYKKIILPETVNCRNKNPHQSILGKTLMTAVRSPARRLVMEYLIGPPPYPCYL